MGDRVVFKTRTRIKGTRVYADNLNIYDPACAPWCAPSSYEAASTGFRTADWNPTGQGPNSLLGGSLDILRRRSREKARNDGQAAQIIDVIVSNAVGVGVKPQFQTKDTGLNQFLSELWYDWTEQSDADGVQDFYGQQAMVLTAALEGGECFVRKRPRLAKDGLLVPLQLQVLESEFVPVEKNQQPSNGSLSQVIQGIEVDAIGKRTAYWMYRSHPGEFGYRTVNRQDFSIVPAEEILHVRQPGRPGQMRGEPWLTRCLIILQDYGKYQDAQLVRQQIASMFAGMVETDPLFAQTFFSGQQSDIVDPAKYFALAPLMPGRMQFLSPGQKITWNAPPGVGGDYDAYMKHQERRIATSGKVLYEQLSGDYSAVNDRTWRAAMLGFRRRIEMLQNHVLIFQMCNPVIQAWLDFGIADGTIKVPKTVDERSLRRVLWITDRWDYINPVQDIAAEAAECRAGFVSRRTKVSERGDDIERLDREIADDQQREEDLGLVFDTNGSVKLSASQQQAAPTEPPPPPPPGSTSNAA